MRAFVVLSALALLTLARPAAAQDDLKAIVDKAIKAHGGLDKVKSVADKAVQTKTKGTIHLPTIMLEYTGTSSVKKPDKIKESLELKINGMTIPQTTIINGDKGWVSAAGMVIELDADIMKGVKDKRHAQKAMALYPLVEKDTAKDFELAALGEQQVEGKPAVGIKVTPKGQADINLFFDKATHLLVKAEYRTVDAMTKTEVTEAMVLLTYKDHEGMKVPVNIRIERDGKKFLEAEVTEFTLLDKIDDSEFAKP